MNPHRAQARRRVEFRIRIDDHRAGGKRELRSQEAPQIRLSAQLLDGGRSRGWDGPRRPRRRALGESEGKRLREIVGEVVGETPNDVDRLHRQAPALIEERDVAGKSGRRFGGAMKGGGANKTTALLRKFVSMKAKMYPPRKTGTCAKHQRLLAESIKRARFMALMPYTVNQEQNFVRF